MRKYKLIKYYPNSPKLGSIIVDTNPGNGANDAWFEENWGKLGKISFLLPKSFKPEDFPEFWEEIKSKPLLFITEDDVKIFEGDIYWYASSTLNTVKECIAHSYTDAARGRGDQYNKKYFSTKQAAEDYIAKNKVLFVTEDGVDIHPNDMYYWVATDNDFYSDWRVNGPIYKSDHSCPDLAKGVKGFSTREKAREYIDNNKPMYSKQQLLNAWKELGWLDGSYRTFIKHIK